MHTKTKLKAQPSQKNGHLNQLQLLPQLFIASSSASSNSKVHVSFSISFIANIKLLILTICITLVRLTSRDSTAGGLRARCASIAAACLLVGCVDATNGAPVAAAEQLKHTEGPAATREIAQWSNKIRKCPPWRENALENVMPENLPRLTGRGRTDGFVSGRRDAPAAGGAAAVRFNKSCYSL